MTETSDPKPTKPFTEAIYDFMCMAKSRSQNDVIRFFLGQVIRHSDICEQGSVLVAMPPDDASQDTKLVVWDTDKNVNSVAEGIKKGLFFTGSEGIAGCAFVKRAPEYTDDVETHPRYVKKEKQDIKSMYCAPIFLRGQIEPFGIVAFHNTRAGNIIDGEKRNNMDVAVEVLTAMLSLSPQKLVSRSRVFIVHGRDDSLRKQLEQILCDEKVEPVLVQASARTGQDLLTFIETEIQDCVAGFVLLTPDDEGRLYRFGEPLRQRARQNVVFESGYLSALFRGTQRVCFLQCGDLEIPSDLHGLLMERFDGRIEKERIQLALEQWNLGSLVKASNAGIDANVQSANRS